MYPSIRTCVLMVALAPAMAIAQSDSTGTPLMPDAQPAQATWCNEADGRRYSTKVWFEGTLEGANAVHFSDGICHMRLSRGWGFSEAPYRCTPSEGGLRIESTMQSRSQGDMVLNVVLQDSTLVGDLTWQKPGQGDLRFEVQGKLQSSAPTAQP